MLGNGRNAQKKGHLLGALSQCDCQFCVQCVQYLLEYFYAWFSESSFD